MEIRGSGWGHMVTALGCPPDPQPGLGRCQGPGTEAISPRTPAPLSVSVNVASALRPGKASRVLGSPTTCLCMCREPWETPPYSVLEMLEAELPLC